jgi:hypothetical protein
MREDLDWKPANEISKDLSRYGIECTKIETKKLSNVKKNELLASGVLSGVFDHKDDVGIEKEFKTRPIEFWRFKVRLEKMWDSFEWDNKAEMLVFHFKIHLFKPSKKVYDWMAEEKLKQQRNEAELEIRLKKQQSEKNTENKKKKRKKKVNTKKKRKKKVSVK